MRYLFVLGFCCLCLSGFAHGDIHTRIEILNAEIKNHRDSLDLYYQRGELLLLHGEYRAAVRDLRRLEKKSASKRVYFLIAKAFHHLGSFEKSDRYLQRIVDPYFFDANIYHLLARNYECRKDYERAALIYQKIIDSSHVVRPESYLDLSNLYLLQNKPELAIGILNVGINEKGYLPVLYQPLIALYEQTADFTAAVAVMDHIVDLSKRKEFALYRRAILLEKLGLDSAGQRDLIDALKLILALPPSVQNQLAVKNLKREILRRCEISYLDQTQQ